MKLDDLLEVSADELALMTPDQLEKHFGPMLNVTRPERVERKVTPQAVAPVKVSSTDQAALAKLGINIGHLGKYGKK